MELGAMPYARYRETTTGKLWDTRHYDGDLETFYTVDEPAGVWTRIAVTARRYASSEVARDELDQIGQDCAHLNSSRSVDHIRCSDCGEVLL